MTATSPNRLLHVGAFKRYTLNARDELCTTDGSVEPERVEASGLCIEHVLQDALVQLKDEREHSTSLRDQLVGGQETIEKLHADMLAQDIRLDIIRAAEQELRQELAATKDEKVYITNQLTLMGKVCGDRLEEIGKLSRQLEQERNANQIYVNRAAYLDRIITALRAKYEYNV